MRRNTRLILALDETNVDKAMVIANETAQFLDAIKINWPLVLSGGPEIITRLSDLSDVICDFKVADIPNTVRLIVEGAVSRGASGVIVHAFPGSDSLIAAKEAAGGAEIYAVTEMSHPGGMEFTAKHAEEMALVGIKCNVDGFIAPGTRPDRIRAIRKIAGDKEIMSPGIGTQGGDAMEAIEAGADHVIVGRSIYGSANPREIASELCRRIS